jgi:multidrug efflux system membrane fusion protein
MRSSLFYMVLVFLTTTACRNNIPEITSENLAGVKITEITPGEVSIPIHSSGILASSEEMKLSFKTGGIVADIAVKEGDNVKKGEILAQLNLSEINAQVSLAGNAYEKALRDYNRAKNLYADTVATLEQLQDATTALNVAQSRLEIVRFNLTHSKIIAPSNGIVLKQLVKTNELVASGYPVFLFGTSGTNWKVRTGLSDRDIVKINPGDSAVIKVDAWPGVSFPALVSLVGGMANPMTGTCDVELIMDDRGYRLANGFVAAIDIYPSKKETLILVPVGSIVEADGETGYIFAVSDSTKVHKIKINIVTIIGSKAGIDEVPREVKIIVSEGAAYLRDGEPVKVVK